MALFIMVIRVVWSDNEFFSLRCFRSIRQAEQYPTFSQRYRRYPHVYTLETHPLYSLGILHHGDLLSFVAHKTEEISPQMSTQRLFLSETGSIETSRSHRD